MARFVTIEKFSEQTGYTREAVRKKIKRGVWLQDRVWRKAPDGHVLIDLEGYAQWVMRDPAACALPLKPASRSISTIAASAAANG